LHDGSFWRAAPGVTLDDFNTPCAASHGGQV
jgi:hypothetical protein